MDIKKSSIRQMIGGQQLLIYIYIYIYIYILYLYRTGIHFREDTVGLGNKTLWYSLKFLMKKMLLRSINWKNQNKD